MRVKMCYFNTNYVVKKIIISNQFISMFELFDFQVNKIYINVLSK